MAIEDVVYDLDGRVSAYRMTNGTMRPRMPVAARREPDEREPTYEELRSSLDELLKAVDANQRMSTWATFFRGNGLQDAVGRAKALLKRVRPRGLTN
ncbi:hypothetical protein AB4Y45_33240 [Paraburkholderia sp. EG287A]|uniref:hypothetical protein n=1 Tax=Paraburkholderia sp. EG287A TaxID=3237012 RepID=UPI0034D2571B